MGKSAVKKYLYEQFVQSTYAPPTFVVPVSDFSEFLDATGRATNVTEGAHCRKLLAHFAWELCTVLEKNPPNANQITSLRPGFDELSAVVSALPPPSDRYPDYESAVQSFLHKHGNWFRKQLFKYRSTHYQPLRSLLTWVVRVRLPDLQAPQPDKSHAILRIRDLWVNLTRKLGYDQLLFVVNRIDEPSGTPEHDYDVDVTLQIARPLTDLVRDGAALEHIHEGVSVKILLWEAAAQRMAFQAGKYNYGRIYWTDAQIIKLLRRRLGAYSNGQVQDVRDIVEPELKDDILSLLIRYAQRIPRILNFILGEAFTLHTGLLHNSGRRARVRAESFVGAGSNASIKNGWVKRSVPIASRRADRTSASVRNVRRRSVLAVEK